MTEETMTTPATTTETTTPTEQTTAPLANSPDARTSTGEIKDAAATTTESSTPVVPDKYEFTVPEGQTLDAALIDSATPIFRELGLDQAGAQKLVDFYTKVSGDAATKDAEAINTVRADWRNQVMADKELGSKIESVKAEIGKAFAQLPAEESKALREALDITGAGDHPAVVKAFYKLAQMVNEGSHVSGAGPSKHGQSPTGNVTRPSMASAMYPNLPS